MLLHRARRRAPSRCDRRGDDPRPPARRCSTASSSPAAAPGTFDLSTEAGALDEIQAGSYVLMDASYDKLDLPFELALSCRATVVSRNGTRAVVDAGLKALSAEYGLPRALDPAIEVVGLADEHATLRVDAGQRAGGRRGDPADPAHIDPTVNLHGALHAVAEDGSVQRWAVDARR